MMPKRSAMAPASGWPSPHSRFCIASARPKTSRPQAKSRLIGWMKKPRLERGPKLSMPIAHPQMMITSGVRQLPRPEDGRSSPVVTAMSNSPGGRVECAAGLMHLHENPKGSRRKFAPQGSAAKSASAIRTATFGVAHEPGSTSAVRNADPCATGSNLGRAMMRLAPTPLARSDISAELWAASASSAEIAAVWAGLPQLGASLPSPQARGR